MGRGIPRYAGAARAGHGHGPYAVRRIRRGVPGFAGANGPVRRMHADGGKSPVGNILICSASTGPSISAALERFRRAM